MAPAQNPVRQKTQKSCVALAVLQLYQYTFHIINAPHPPP